ncbi:LPS-assembly protein LptD [Denitromonas sp. IR12]|uniref:LPS-assembly protein LptD n=1 Tax=Denitromonas iodatirespirans TaxID=2795389 RepID=A0A944DMC3_DENI1|nr:LPS-assembly protein LptD [Denitromonas iodatirespirans]
MRAIPLLLATLPVAGSAADLPALVIPADLLGTPATKSKPAAVDAKPPMRGTASPSRHEGTEAVGDAPARRRDRVSASRPAPAAEATAPTEPTGVTTVDADRIVGQQDVELVAEGQAVLKRDRSVLTADRIVYREALDEVEAEGNVTLRRGEDRLAGPKVQLRLDEQTGTLDSPTYEIHRISRKGGISRPITGSGEASVIRFEGENQYRLEDATWSTCQPQDPDWYIKAGELELDYDREIGVARHSTVVFQDVPIFYMPWAEFPLVAQRKSGFLPPTFGTSNKSGVELTAPYYWNIAPNYDATLVPRYISRRGLQLGGQYRYLTETMQGTTSLEWLSSDSVTGQSNRAAGSIRHQQNFGYGLSGSLDLNGVSDKEYFEDLSSRLALSAQTNLLRQGVLSYSSGSWWSASALAQSFQTLSGERPYRRLPQFTLGGNRLVWGGGEFNLATEYVRFAHPDANKPEGSRITLNPSVQFPLGTAAYTLTPKFGVHYTRYDLSTPLTVGEESITRAVPTFSLDGAMVFERETVWGGRDMIQTLEPRLYYVNVPYRDQSDIPNFDSGLFDFNFAQIFSENIFSGGDRIANANQLTAAVTSRMIDAETGVERLRAALGQRFYFEDQRVTLPGFAARTGRRTDILASLGGRIGKITTLDAGWQYSPEDRQTERFNADLRFQPAFAKVVNLGYRYTRDVLRDVDIAAQWPLGGRWYGVARYNRSLRDHRVTEALGGLEYDADCWVFRVVVHRYATNAEDVTQAIFLQLELDGLASVGSSPLDLLRRTVGGYGTINQPMADPVFGRE